jgi:putative acyl-CoA dehydrogenase
METLGGNGYVEDGRMGRIYREMPVNAIWEGSGNVMCLDVLRAIEREHEAADALVAGFETAAGGATRLVAAIGRLRAMMTQRGGLEARARLVTELLVAVAAGTLLQAHAPAAVADGFLATRLAPDRGRCYGALETAIDETAILERAMPVG